MFGSFVKELLFECYSMNLPSADADSVFCACVFCLSLEFLSDVDVNV